MLSYATESHWFSKSAPACVKTGNVSTGVDKDKGIVWFKNNNMYKVTVTWKAFGYTTDGKEIVIGGATITLEPYEYVTKTVRTNSRYKSYSVDLEVEKCD